MRGFWLLTAAVLCAIGIGIGAEAGSAVTSPLTALRRAATATNDAGSADVAMSIVVSGTKNGTVHAKGYGAIDFRHNGLNIAFGLPSRSGSSLRLIVADHVVYLGSPALGQMLNGKQWISVPAGKGSIGAASGLFNPTPSLQQAIRSGTTVTTNSVSSASGAHETVYHLVIAPNALIAAIAGGRHLSTANRTTLDHELKGASLSAVAFVDSSGRLVSIDEAITLLRSKIALSWSLKFTNFGTPVEVQAPPASSTVPLNKVQHQLLGLVAPSI